MCLLLTIFGLVFTIGLSILINYIYSIYSINKITKFIKPTEDTTFNNISVSFIPIVLWALIELPLLANNKYFSLGLALNLFITMAVSYIIKYGYTLISNKESEIVNIIAICTSLIFGYIINYICLLIGKTSSIVHSIIGIICIIGIYLLVKTLPPKSEFFRGNQIKNSSK